MSACRADKDRTVVTSLLGNRVTVERRRADGMTWTRIEPGMRSGEPSEVIALDAEESWAFAKALIEQVEPLEGSQGDG